MDNEVYLKRDKKAKERNQRVRDEGVERK